MRKEVIKLIIEELLNHIEEIKRLEIKDRLGYVGILVEEISGVPAVYLPVDATREILGELGKEVILGRNFFS